jgi:hypothetical protein
MKMSIPRQDLAGLIDHLSFVHQLCGCEAPLLSTALERFMPNTGWDAALMGSEALAYADYLAQAMGYPDADMDRDKATPRRPDLDLYR